MLKGKQFNAAQKHFDEKELKSRREKERLTLALLGANEELELTKKQLQKTMEENESLKKEHEQIMRVQGLTPEQVQRLVDGAGVMKDFVGMVGAVTGSRYLG